MTVEFRLDVIEMGDSWGRRKSAEIQMKLPGFRRVCKIVAENFLNDFQPPCNQARFWHVQCCSILNLEDLARRRWASQRRDPVLRQGIDF